MGEEEKKREEPNIDKGEPLGEENIEQEDVEYVEEAEGSPENPSSMERTEEIAEDEQEEHVDEPADPALLEELEVVRKERDDYLDAVRRIKAEFDNFRKRQERERERFTQIASERLVMELLPVMDNLERAIESEGDIRDGVKATRDQLASVLEQVGLVPVISDGEHFDPNFHEAVMGQSSEDHEEGTVLQTFQRGYVLNGRAIRPAKVVVARQD